MAIGERGSIEMAGYTLPEERSAQKSTALVHTLALVGGIALYLLFGLVLWWGLDLYIAPQTSTEKKDLVQALGLIMAGVAGAIGIYFTWRGQRLTQESLESTRVNTEEQLRLTREGQITERFTRAIDQLGATNDDESKSLEIRLGAIYALARIAAESEEDHWPIMEILTAYVRKHAPRKEEPGEEAISEVPQLDPDIQAIMTVLRRRTRHYGNGESERLDLHGTDLKLADLRSAHLEGAQFWGATLRKASLRGAHLDDAYLWKTDLMEADLNGAHFEGAFLGGFNRWSQHRGLAAMLAGH